MESDQGVVDLATLDAYELGQELQKINAQRTALKQRAKAARKALTQAKVTALYDKSDVNAKAQILIQSGLLEDIKDELADLKEYRILVNGFIKTLAF